MSRWEPNARARLERAAAELFAAQGFAATTVPQIAERAGLTRRTFFRHFQDKREVIFAGDEIPQLAARMIAAAPPGLDGMTLLRTGLREVADTRFEAHRARTRMLRTLIAADEDLRERDLRKRTALSEVVREGFTARGETPLRAALLASIAVEVLHIALDSWLQEDSDAAPLRDHLDDAFAALGELTAAG